MSRKGLGSRFWRFWTGSAISQMGDGIRVTALPLLAASITRDPVPVATITAAVWLPWLLFGALGGAIVDRVDRRRLMRNVQLIRMLVTGGLVAAVLLERESIPVLAAAAFLIGIGEVLVDSALYSVVPRVVREEVLEQANGRIGAAELVGNELAGPPLGGLFFGISHWIPFAIDSLTFGASGLILQRIEHEFRIEDSSQRVTSIWEDVLEGVRWLAGHRVLRTMALGLGAINISVTGVWAVLVLFSLEVLEVGGAGYGLLLTAGATGGLIGSLVAAEVARAVGRSCAMLGPLAIGGLTVVLVGLMSNPFAAGAMFFINGFMVGVFNVIGRTLRQVLTPNRLLGRITSGFRVLSYGMASVGAVVGGAITAAFGLRAPFFFGGVLMVATTFVMGIWVNERAIAQARGHVGVI